jgi:hypothetical protein
MLIRYNINIPKIGITPIEFLYLFKTIYSHTKNYQNNILDFTINNHIYY